MAFKPPLHASQALTITLRVLETTYLSMSEQNTFPLDIGGQWVSYGYLAVGLALLIYEQPFALDCRSALRVRWNPYFLMGTILM